MSHTNNTSKKATENLASIGEKKHTGDGATAKLPGHEIHHNQVPLHIFNILE